MAKTKSKPARVWVQLNAKHFLQGVTMLADWADEAKLRGEGDYVQQYVLPPEKDARGRS